MIRLFVLLLPIFQDIFKRVVSSICATFIVRLIDKKTTKKNRRCNDGSSL